MAPSEAEASRILGGSSEGTELERDQDVLDTWFCSALIPIVLSGEIFCAALCVMEGFQIPLHAEP